MFPKKAARRRSLKELKLAVREAGAAAKREYKALRKQAWLKPETAPSCPIRASFLGYDKQSKREALECQMRDAARSSRRKGDWLSHVLQLMLGVIHLEIGEPSYETKEFKLSKLNIQSR